MRKKLTLEDLLQPLDLSDVGEIEATPGMFCATGGIVFSDGNYVELMRDTNGDVTLKDSRPREERHRPGMIYTAPILNSSVSRLLILPKERVSFGSTAGIFKAICELFPKFGISADIGKLFTYFGIATWFVDLLPIAPCLLIAGPRPEAQLALQLLGCVVRHGLAIADISPADLRRLAMCTQPTLLLANLQKSMHQVLITSLYPGAHVPRGDGFVDLYSAKAVYAGPTVPYGLPGQPILTVHLAPSHKRLPVISPAKQRALTDYFQPQLLDYRLRYALRVRQSDFDVPMLSANVRILVQALGSCIVDASDLQADIVGLVKPQQELSATDNWIDPQRVIIEAILDRCHADQTCSRLGIGEIAETATKMLRNRGEATNIEPKLAGRFVRTLGLSPKRDMEGYALHLDEEVRRKAHQLIRDYEVQFVPNPDNSCPYCAEILRDSSRETGT